ncbi:hypothetical protein BV20DRAFT_456485 [Pilatotrama ljubarskyi]|nr:hypothetical protein BV20DRAFT_456485 [Pilatotrama ljubarskyi]
MFVWGRRHSSQAHDLTSPRPQHPHFHRLPHATRTLHSQHPCPCAHIPGPPSFATVIVAQIRIHL